MLNQFDLFSSLIVPNALFSTDYNCAMILAALSLFGLSLNFCYPNSCSCHVAIDCSVIQAIDVSFDHQNYFYNRSALNWFLIFCYSAFDHIRLGCCYQSMTFHLNCWSYGSLLNALRCGCYYVHFFGANQNYYLDHADRFANFCLIFLDLSSLASFRLAYAFVVGHEFALSVKFQFCSNSDVDLHLISLR